MSVTLTEEQSAAISARGKAIVSASAGSGKTFVMIERLVSLILEGTDVRNVLAVTFTNKAAAQMRDRLRQAILKKIGESPEAERARLKLQLKELPLAEISTIHAWCSRLVRTYFYLADVDPAFRVVSPDDAEGKQLSARALEEVFESRYDAPDEGFSKLLSVYFRKKKDSRLKATVLSLYFSVRGRADYRAFLEEAGREDGYEEVCAFLADEYRRRAARISDEAEEISVHFDPSSKALLLCRGIRNAAEAVRRAGSLRAACALSLPKLPNAPSSAKAEGTRLARIKRLAALSAAVKELYKELASYDEDETERARYLDGQETVRALADLLLRFDDAYFRLKREAGVLDYDDLEHCALTVLSDEEARAAVREKISYLFVDEYQDVNPAQERILSLAAGEEAFLVGDPKQSIYGFRGSRSEYFVRKEEEFPGKFALSANFRSASAILEEVNRVFSYAMTKESAGIDYAACPMRGGSRFGAHDGAVLYHRIPDEKAESEERGVYSVLKDVLPPVDAQAELIASLIEEEVGSTWFDADAGVEKRVTFGDVAVLVRKNSGDAEKIVAALGARNIPVTTTAGVNVCDFWEARLVVDWLSYLDNPEQDVPFAGALLSRIGGMTDAELARIRLRKRDEYTFRGACREYLAEVGPDGDEIARKLAAFYRKAEDYRALMRVRTAAETIGLLLSDGLEAEIAAGPEGELRLRRVRRLMAEGSESVNAFLRRLRALDFKVEHAESGGEAAVKVLTMHATKGLEYPVVFLASLDTPFRLDRDEILLSDRFGFAPKSYDLKRKLVSETVLRRASQICSDRENGKGELNLLYVAMTRAKFRLHLLLKGKEAPLFPDDAKRLSDFLPPRLEWAAERGRRAAPATSRTALAAKPDEEALALLRKAYARPYPFAESTRLSVKSSATELLKEEEGTFSGGGGGSVEEGLAYHAFLEHVDFSRPVEEELARVRADGLLSEERLALLDPEKLSAILALPALRGLGGKRLYRERKFLLSLPAREVPSLGTDSEEEIVFQGALDLLVEDEEGYLIIDYKYSGGTTEYLKTHYAPQLALYKKAVARAMGIDERTVRAKIVNLKLLCETDA